MPCGGRTRAVPSAVPSTSTDPLEKGCAPVIARSVVVFPAPLAPTITVTWPLGTVRSRPRTTGSGAA